jgi:hypothetical protein
MVKFVARFAQYRGRSPGDFRADAIAWQQDDRLLHLQPQFGKS